MVKARCAALALLIVSTPATARADDDPWIAGDKAAHFGVSAGIGAGSYALGAAIFDARGHALIFAGAVTLTAGGVKELADLAGAGVPSWKDFAWDAIGAVTGLAIAWSVDLLVRGVSDEHPLFRLPRPVVSF
ncbi:MAG: hypothetical protein KF819_04980 [Labilithrix sp.]|nr:hypothetical protein [Labilithrix sp.]